MATLKEKKDKTDFFSANPLHNREENICHYFSFINDNCFPLEHLSGVGSEMVKKLKKATETLLNVFQKWLVTVIRKARGQQERKCEIKIEESNAKILPGAQ